MDKEIISRQTEAMAEADLDILIATSPENFAYTTGFVVPSQSLMRWRHAVAVVSRNGLQALIIVDMEESTVRSCLPEVDIRVWKEFEDHPMETLGRLLKDMGAESASIGIEMDFLPAGDFERLKRFLPEARFHAAEGLFNRLRQRKTPGEIDLMRRLSRITDQSIGVALKSVRAGMTEMDLGAALLKEMYSQGAENFKLMIVATGERSEFPNVGPTHRVLKRGDPCRVEIFGIIGGYHAAVCRTAVVQEPSPDVKRIWRHLIECKALVLDMIRPGASTRSIYEAFLKKFSELDLPPISFVGHGIGLHLHEEPYLGGNRDSRLETGMVLGVEPLVYGWGKGFGLQIKDMVLVTSTGCEVLSDRTVNDELIMIP